jgi:anti-sigma B factor antagonist
LVLDLSQARTLTSAALRVLQGALTTAREREGDIRLAVPPGPVADTLTAAGAHSFFQFFPDVEAAVRDFHLRLAEEIVEDATVLRLDGSLDEAAVPRLEERLHTLLGEGRRHLVLDLAGVTTVSSPGFAALQNVLLALHARGGDLRLAALQPAAKAVADELGFTPEFRVFPDAETAALSFD